MSLTQNEEYALKVKTEIDNNMKQITIKLSDTLLFDELCNYALDNGYKRVYFDKDKVKSSSGESFFFISGKTSKETIELIGVFEYDNN